MDIYKAITSLLFSSLLTACATTGGSSFTPSESVNASSIKGYWNSESAFTWEGYGLLAVDNKFISRGMFGDPSTAITKVDPGPREIVVTVRFNKGLGTGPFETMVPMDVDLKPATEYQLKGAVEGATVKTWLEFALTGEKASNTYTATYGKSARQPAPIPVFIPAR